MKLNVLIDLDLNDTEKGEAERNAVQFCNKYIKFEGLNGKWKIINASNYNGVLIKDCGFPVELNEAFIDNDIYFLNELSSYRYQEMYKFVYSIVRDSKESEKYTNMIYQHMKEHSIPYVGIKPDELIRIDECGLSVRVVNALTRANLFFLQDVAMNTRDYIMKTRNLGEGSLKELECKLREYDLWYLEA